MPKMKTHRAAAKRFSRTGRGRFRRRRAGHRHGMIGKSSARNRRLRGSALVARADERSVRRLLPYAGEASD